MRSTACEEIEALIDREAHGWNDAERLRVEQHLCECGNCAGTLALSRSVRGALQGFDSELSDAARNRAISRALDQSRKPRAAQQSRRLPSWTGMALGFAAAAAIALALFVRAPTQVATVPKDSTRAPDERSAAANEPTHETSPATPPAALAKADWIETATQERRQLAHAQVSFGPATRARFEATERTLLLERGRVDIDVDASRGQSFRVKTERFRVEVLGTVFSVTPDTVVVTRGHVRVFDLQNEALLRELGAGSTFTYTAAAPKSEAQPATPSASELLRQARDALAHGDSNLARKLARRAEQAKPLRAERAEAVTLRAEAALLDGDGADAQRLYREVSTRYPELPAGENATFAAAQLAAKHDPAQGGASFEAYVQRYPTGRFIDEARQRLKQLKSRSP